MDIRSIFRNYLFHVITDGGTQEARRADEWTCRFRSVGGSPRQIRGSQSLRDHGEGGLTRKVADATLPRKASKEWEGYPYRKPTQVGEEKILRRE